MGRYRLERLLGRGGMGAIHLATQLSIDKSVAIKTLRADLVEDARALERFQREAEAVLALDHPNIVRVLDYGVDQTSRTPFIVMEYLQGRSLRALIEAERSLSEMRACALLAQVSKALVEAHGKGIVHRDLKPENIIVRALPDGDEHAKVLDFGIAKLMDSPRPEITATNAFVGTPLYSSPEQVSGKPLDARADLYGLGCILHELLAGQPPFVGEQSMRIMMQHLADRPPPLPERLIDGAAPSPLVVALRSRLLAKQPTARPSGAAPVAKVLAALGRGALGDISPSLSVELRLAGEPDEDDVVTSPAITADPATTRSGSMPQIAAVGWSEQQGDGSRAAVVRIAGAPVVRVASTPVARGASGAVARGASGDVPRVASGDLARGAGGDVARVASGDVARVASGDVARVASGDVARVASAPGERSSSAEVLARTASARSARGSSDEPTPVIAAGAGDATMRAASPAGGRSGSQARVPEVEISGGDATLPVAVAESGAGTPVSGPWPTDPYAKTFLRASSQSGELADDASNRGDATPLRASSQRGVGSAPIEGSDTTPLRASSQRGGSSSAPIDGDDATQPVLGPSERGEATRPALAASEGAASIFPSGPARGSWAGAAIASAAVIIASCLVALALMLSSEPAAIIVQNPTPAPSTETPAPAPAASAVAVEAAPAQSTVTLESEPAGASVLVAGEELGRTPVTLTLPLSSDGFETFVLRKPGYEDHRERVKLDDAVRVRVALSPTPAAAAPAAAAPEATPAHPPASAAARAPAPAPKKGTAPAAKSKSKPTAEPEAVIPVW